MEPTTPAPTTPPPAASYVDPQYTGPSNSPFNQQNAFRLLVGLLGLVMVGELAWAGYTLTRPVQAPVANDQPVVITAPSPIPAAAVIVLTGPTEATKGAVIKVDIDLASTEQADGADLIIKYDPKVLQATTITPGTIYADYPVKNIDAVAGKINISAVTGPDIVGFSGQGMFGSITFKALRAGQTTIAIDYTADVTTDSNVLGSKAEKDILSTVKDLTINIK